MKRNVLIFGLISGLIVATVMGVGTLMCYRKGDFGGNMVVGFASMIVAFSFIFVAIKNYRDKQNGDTISFGKAISIGLLVTLIGSTLYVVTWLFLYYNYMPDFMDKLAEHEVSKAKESGGTAAELSKLSSNMDSYREMYKNPLMIVLMTYAEIAWIGVLVSIIAALVLKRKPKVIDTSVA